MKDLQTLTTEYETSYNEHTIRTRGREDGEKGIPHVDTSALSPYESELLHSGKLLASKVAGVYRSKLEGTDGEIKAAIAAAHQKLKDDEAKVQDSYNANKSLHEQAFTLRAARDAYELSKKRFDIMFSKVGRMPVEYIPHWLYVIFAFVIFIGEIPLNAMVFQIFGENQVMTWVMAFVIGLSIPVSAHFVGLKAREHHGAIHWPNVWKALAVTTVIVVALYGLAEMRHDYLQAMKDELGLTEQLIETSYLFFWLNVAVFGAAVIVAYLSHDPVPGYAELYKELTRAQKKLEGEEQKKADGLKWVEMARVNELDKARKEHRAALEAANKLKGSYDEILMDGREQEERCLHLARRDISIYRHENLRHRKDTNPPKCFSVEPEFQLVLKTISEKLVNEQE